MVITERGSGYPDLDFRICWRKKTSILKELTHLTEQNF